MTERVGEIPGSHLFQASSIIGEETEAEKGRASVAAELGREPPSQGSLNPPTGTCSFVTPAFPALE